MNRLRFRSGQVQLRRVRVAAETVISAGDLLWLDGNTAKPASALDWETDLATTQAEFASKFLGVAHQPSAAGEALPVSVDISADAVYDFDCVPASYELGEALGVAAQGEALLSQQLAAAAPAAAIARAAEFSNGTVQSLRVTLASAFGVSSSNVHAQLG